MSTFLSNLAKAGEEILEKIGRKAVWDNFRIGSAGKAVPGKVTSRSGRLMAAVLGDFGQGAIRIIDVTKDPARFTIGVRSPYAALIHDGGVRVVTEKMRRFFWAKYLTTPAGAEDYTMWRALRYKTTIRYEPRPFLGSTVHAMIPEMSAILKKHGITALRLEIKKIITGAVRAVPLAAIK
jgi:hypothetical protein